MNAGPGEKLATMRAWGMRQGWSAAALLCIVVILAANRRFLTGEVFPVFDADGQFAPWQMLIGDFARAGRLLLWNPWSSGGSPDYADPQFGAFSPLSVLFGALFGGTLNGFLAYWLCTWTLAGIGMLMLCRHLGSPAWGGIIVSLGFLFSGFFTGHAQHVSHIVTLAWLPWIIWRLDVALLNRRGWPAAQAGALWGLSALGGYPGLVLLTGTFAFLWAAGRVACRPAEPRSADRGDSRDDSVTRPRVRHALPAVALLFVVGMIVLSPTYLAFMMEGKGFTGRVEELSRIDALESNALHPAALSSLASPYLGMLWFFNGNNFWSYTDGSSNSLYVGALVLCLAIGALAMAPKDAWRWWLFGLALLSVGCALARVLPLRGWLYDWLPPFRYFRHPAIFRDYAIFSLAVLAAIGSRDIAAGFGSVHSAARRWLWVSIILAAAAIAAFFLVLQTAPNLGPEVVTARVCVLLNWSAAVLLADRLTGKRKTARHSLWLALALVLAVADALAAHSLSRWTLSQTSPQLQNDWQTIAMEHRSDLSLMRNRWYRALKPEFGPMFTNKNLPLKRPVLYSYTPFQNPFLLQWIRKAVLNAAVVGDSRIWFSAAAVQVPLTLEAFELFAVRAEALKALPLVISDPDAASSAGSGGSAPLDPAVRERLEKAAAAESMENIRLLEYLPERLSLQIVSQTDGWLLVSDRWSSGWSVTVNGQAQKIWVGDFLFRAVQVRKGRSQIEFSYQAYGFPYLLMASWGMLAVVGGGSLVQALRKKARSRDPRQVISVSTEHS